MTSAERLLAALELREADRVPVSTYNLGAYGPDHWQCSDPSYARLMRAVRERTDVVRMWGPASNVRFLHSACDVPVDVTERREGDATVTEQVYHTPKGDLRRVTKVIDGVHTTWEVEHLCKSLEDVEKALSVPYEPVAYEAGEGAGVERELGDRGIVMGDASDALCSVAPLMEFGEYTVWAMTEPEHFQRTLDRVHERVMENLRRKLRTCVSPLYRICGCEYATPPFLPPESFARFVAPYVREIAELVHAHGAKARIHCHGRIGRVLDMILDTGVDAIDPCEPPPDGDIELADVKRRAGSRLCIFGNIEVKLLESGSGDDVEREVKRAMDAAKRGGGFVLSPSDSVYGSPLPKKTEENYLRFIDAAHRYGKY
jgi:uroporphyrinogen-III decarboxylase